MGIHSDDKCSICQVLIKIPPPPPQKANKNKKTLCKNYKLTTNPRSTVENRNLATSSPPCPHKHGQEVVNEHRMSMCKHWCSYFVHSNWSWCEFLMNYETLRFISILGHYEVQAIIKYGCTKINVSFNWKCYQIETLVIKYLMWCT